MALERKNKASEFETMLRRHLRSGGSPVSACAGFDADKASAYLEGALGSISREHYEGHLAGCPACRRDVIELSRLSQLALRTEMQALAVAAASGWWAQLALSAKHRLDRWTDLSTWRWNWRLAGSALAACAAIMAVMVVKPWRQPLPATQKVYQATAAAPNVVASEISIAPSPTPPADNIAVTVPDNRAIVQPKPEGTVPPPSIQMPAVSGAQSAERFFDQPARESLNAGSRSIRPQQSFDTTNTTPPPTISAGRVSQTLAQDAVDRSANNSAKNEDADKRAAGPAAEIFQIQDSKPRPELPLIMPDPGDNPMQASNKGTKMVRSDQVSPLPERTGLYDRIIKYWKGYIPGQKPEGLERSFSTHTVSLGKTIPAPKEEDEKEFSPLVRTVRDKNLYFVRGVWIDEAYKPEKMAWRVTQLTRGSKEYKRVLAEEPQLEEFFALGRVIVMWRDKIYRVTDREKPQK